MKYLILIRHAKSSWETPLQDRDRPICRKGIAAAHLIATNCSAYIPNNYIIWSSTAKRASETAIIFAQINHYPIESIVFKEDLYTFDESKLQKVIATCNDTFDHLIVFGHNEAITFFVNKYGNIKIDNVPTSGFVSLQFDCVSWSKLTKGSTLKTLFPKEL